MRISQFVYLFTYEGHIGYFQFLAIMNKAGINVYVQIFAWAYVFKSFG